jgi:hypothetical protein
VDRRRVALVAAIIVFVAAGLVADRYGLNGHVGTWITSVLQHERQG